MEIKAYNKLELNELIESGQFYYFANIPISKHRALSQIKNPRASEHDILLVVAYDDNEVVGYLGVLPDFFYNGDSKEKVGWLSCFWVDENYRNQEVAASLFFEVFNAWENKILITNFVPTLEAVYQRTKLFQPTIYKNGFRGYLRFNFADLLPPKKKIFKKLVPILGIIDFLLNLFQDIRISLFRHYHLGDIRFEYLTCLDKYSDEFVDAYKKRYWTQRGKDELDWINQYPWIIEGDIRDFNSSRYYFSSLNQRFFNQTVKFTDRKNNIIAVILITIRDKHLNIPYIFADGSHMKIISKFLINKMIELKLDTIVTFNTELADSLKTIKFPFYFRKSTQKPYLISKQFDFIKDLRFQDGDGDCVFY